MSFNFPDNPSNGDSVTHLGITYVYNSSIPAWTVDTASAGQSGSSYGNKFVMVIPQDAISSGTPAYETFITFDRGFGRSVKHRVLTAQFGDGYDQTLTDGVNTKNDTFSATFKNRLAYEINLISDFLDLRAAKEFEIRVPNRTGIEIMYVRPKSYSITYDYDQFHTLTAQLTRIYTPRTT
jgi:phage-related protein